MEQNAPLYLGIDGGGTNCRGRLRDAAGNLLGEAHGGPANTRLGVEQAQEQIFSVAKETLSMAGLGDNALSLAHLGVGLAGLHIAADREDFMHSGNIPSPPFVSAMMPISPAWVPMRVLAMAAS